MARSLRKGHSLLTRCWVSRCSSVFKSTPVLWPGVTREDWTPLMKGILISPKVKCFTHSSSLSCFDSVSVGSPVSAWQWERTGTVGHWTEEKEGQVGVISILMASHSKTLYSLIQWPHTHWTGGATRWSPERSLLGKSQRCDKCSLPSGTSLLGKSRTNLKQSFGYSPGHINAVLACCGQLYQRPL